MNYCYYDYYHDLGPEEVIWAEDVEDYYPWY